MSELTARRFRITAAEGPRGLGPIHSHYSFTFSVELDPGEPYAHEEYCAVVRVRDIMADYLAEGAVDVEPGLSCAVRRLQHFVVERLRIGLSKPGAPRRQLLEPTDNEIETLRRVDPARIKDRQWFDVHGLSTARTKRVFISCGQQTAAERALGERIATMVADKSQLEGYFAQNQQSLEGVTANIFDAIRTSAAFIAVMHRRGEIRRGEYRGSVWVEQEIAIAAFMVQSLASVLPARVFVQRGIVREGVRGFILLNAVEFEDDEEVLTHLEGWLPLLKGLAE